MQDVNDATAAPTAERWSGLRQRSITAAAIAIPTLLAVWAGGWLFSALILLAAIQMHREWEALTRNFGGRWSLYGLAYVILPCVALLWMRNQPSGFGLVLYLILVIAATDIGAYFTGRTIGGAKLAPAISPGKTWAGLGGGMVCAGLIGIAALSFSPYPMTFSSAIIISMLLAVVAQASDLFESWIKRRAGVKDSGTLIPGHGGLLDRVDGYIFTAPLLALLAWISAL